MIYDFSEFAGFGKITLLSVDILIVIYVDLTQ